MAGKNLPRAARTAIIRQVRLTDLKNLRWRGWLIVLAGTALLVSLTATSLWTFRHAWAIYKLNRGVGDLELITDVPHRL